MSAAPITVFSSTNDAPSVLESLRGSHAGLTVIQGTENEWREVRASWADSEPLTVRYDPSYTADANWSRQLPSMVSYFLRAPGSASVEVLAAIRALRFAVTFVARELTPQHWAAVFAVCRRLDGLIFVPGALLDAEGRELFAPGGQVDPRAVLPRPAPPHPLLLPTGGLYDRSVVAPGRTRSATREASCRALEQHGFAAAYGLPEHQGLALRPPEQLAERLLALRALFLWVARLNVPAATLDTHLDALTMDERKTFALTREQANAEHGNLIGWRLENMWPLAWCLGFEPAPPFAEGMIDGPTIEALLDFVPATATVRPQAQVEALHDVFYLAHHAVRSAQLGRATVPASFHPLFDGGCVHERRHALAWALAPDTAWDDVTLST